MSARKSAGVDLAQPIADAAFCEIRRAFGKYGVVFFRDQHLTPEQPVSFAERSEERRVGKEC